MTERELTGEVLRLAGQLGLMYHHCQASQRCLGNPGFPDLVIAGKRGVIFAELKTESGETSARQDLWHWLLMQTAERVGPVGVELWRPSDWRSGLIRRALAAIA